MTALKSIGFCVGWIITAYIGLWAMVLYGITIGIIAWRMYDRVDEKHGRVM